MTVSEYVIHQIYLSGLSFVYGLGLMCGYYCLQHIRHLLFRREGYSIAYDLFFWFLAWIVIFQMFRQENHGQLRWYALAAIALGMGIYRFVRKILLKKIHKVIRMVLQKD